MFVSRAQIVHGENLLKSNIIIMDTRVRGTANIVASNVCTITAHTSDVLSVAFSGTVLATCSSDKTVRLWKTQDFTELPCSPLTGHQYLINCCEFSPMGTTLATCSTDGTLRLWDTETGDALAILSHHTKCALRVCSFSRDGSMIVTGGDDDSVCLWNVPERKLIRCFKGHDESVTAVAFTPDGNYIISGSSGGDLCGELLVWDAQFGHGKFLKRVPDCHDLGVLCCEFSPTYGTAGKTPSCPYGRFLLATGGKDNLVKLWFFDCEVGSVNVTVRLDTMLPGHTDSVLWLRFSPDGKYIASCSLDKTARLWNTETKQTLLSIDEHSSYVASCAFSNDSKYLATASNDCTVKIWQLTDTSKIMHNLGGYEEGIETSNSNSGLSQVPMETWKIDDVCKWLTSLDLSEHEDKFRANAIDGKELLTLTAGDLKTMLGVVALGHRNKILRERAAAKHKNITLISDKHAEHNSMPDEFLCPITHELMKDPVIASDGYTYDRPAIVNWITKVHRSPMTNELLTSTDVTPNRTLKMMIQKFVQNVQSERL